MLLGCGGAAEPQPSVSVDTSPRDLSNMPCNVDGDSQPIPIRNAGPGSLTWSARTEGPFAIDGSTSGVVPSGGVSQVSFRSRIPSSTPLLARVDGAVVISTNDPSHPETRIEVSAIARGAWLHVTSSLDFGEVPIGGTLDHDVWVQNVGEGPVDVEVGAPSDPRFETHVTSFTAAVGKGAVRGYFRFTALASGAVDATVPVTYRGAVCNAPPSPWSLTARGVKGTAVSPGKLDFGFVDCLSAGTPQTVHVVNSSSNIAIVTVKLPSASSHFTTDAYQAVVTPLGYHDFVVTPQTIPLDTPTTPNGLGETLEITTDLPGDYTHVVTLEETANGAVLSMPPLTAVGRRLIDGAQTTVSIPLTNSGNAPALVYGSTTGNTATFPPTAIAAGATVNVVAALTPDAAKIGRVDSRTVSYSLTGPRCGLDAPKISMTPFDTAIDVSSAWSGAACVLGHTGRLYCGGQFDDAFVSEALPAVGLVANVTGTRVFASHTASVCVQSGSAITCHPDTPMTFTVPAGTVKVFPSAYVTCAIGPTGSVQCVGMNDTYQFGNGSTAATQWTQWKPAMTGVSGAIDFATDGNASLVVSGGQVLGAGRNDAFALLQGNDASFTAQTPIVLPGLTNVTRVVTQSQSQGACALHGDGTATCWDQNGLHSITGIVDAVDIAGGFGFLCAIRQNGAVRCSDGAINFPNIWDLQNLVTPVQRITPWCALEANGAVTCWSNGVQNVGRLQGFEGP